MAAPKPARIAKGPESHAWFPVSRALGEVPKGRLERLLSLFADIGPGEGADALLLALPVFLLFTAHSLLKPIRNSRAQMFATSRVVCYAGIAGNRFIVPTFSRLNYSAMALAPAIGILSGSEVSNTAASTPFRTRCHGCCTCPHRGTPSTRRRRSTIACHRSPPFCRLPSFA